MANFVVCKQDELSAAANNISNYADYLLRKMDYYLKTLAWVQENGIKDNLISSELTALADEVKTIVIEVESAVNSQIIQLVNEEISEIEEAERFDYPASFLQEVTAIFGGF